MSARQRPAPRDLPEDGFAASVCATLSRPRKRIESKWLYDEEGSRLFDRICELPEYYPTRTETGILREKADRLAAIVPPGAAMVELGSGSSVKTRIVLDALPTICSYVPVDISAEHLTAAAARLAGEYPNLAIHPVAGDFTATIPLPPQLREQPKLLFFPGSTIGNFSVPQAQGLLGRLRQLPNLAGFVIGTDLRKDVDRLIRAYDDEQGVTAAFNINLLVRMNRELEASFDLGSFRHEARWNEAQGRIEMHLVSLREQVVEVAGHVFTFDKGETIHTENSHKFSLEGFGALARDAGWETAEVWTDGDSLFSVHVLTPS